MGGGNGALIPRTRPEMLSAALEALDATSAPWCILHGYAGYPVDIPSDVDMIVPGAPWRVMRSMAPVLCRQMRLVQVLDHQRTASYFVLSTVDRSPPAFLHLDISCDYRWNGRVFLSADEVLRHRRRHRGMWVPPPAAEFAYYMIKKVAKAGLDDAQATRLSELFAQDPEGCTRQLKRFFGGADARLIEDAARRDEWSAVRRRIASIRRGLLRGARWRYPLGFLRYWRDDIQRRVLRVIRPTGVLVAVLGPDGSGKTTLLTRVATDLAAAFRGTRRYHLRPHFGKGSGPGGPPNTNPHRDPPRGAIASLAKAVYWWLDYIVGYILDIRPRLVRSTLVLFDRHYFDLLVDGKRYRWGGSLWPARVAGRFLPKPHLFILLDAGPEVLRARKGEVSAEESARLRAAYLELARTLPACHVVDASRTVEEVAAEVETIVLDYMASRTERWLGL